MKELKMEHQSSKCKTKAEVIERYNEWKCSVYKNNQWAEMPDVSIYGIFNPKKTGAFTLDDICEELNIKI